MVITIAPLLGLLGTVSGLVTVFGALGEESILDANPKEVAQGIAKALSTTIVGLAITIPTVIAHSYFSRKIEKYIAEIEALLENSA